MDLAVRRAWPGAAARVDDFEAFYTSGFPTVYRATLAFSGSSDVAGEATQEAFVRAFARWRRLSKAPWALGWVMTTSLNVARRLAKQHPQERDPESDAGHESDARWVERLDLVERLALLPPRQRQAVVLHYLGGFEIAEIAHLMNLSIGGVKSNLFKGRAALRRIREARDHAGD